MESNKQESSCQVQPSEGYIEYWRYCPACGRELDIQGCKRRCLGCGYYEGCSDG